MTRLAARGESRTEPFAADSGRMQEGTKRGILGVFKRVTTQHPVPKSPQRRRGGFLHGPLGGPPANDPPPNQLRGESGNLKQRLASRKAALVDGWLDRAVRVYPPETAALFRRERDPFSNPVGCALSAGIRGLIDGLLSDADAGQLGSCIERILKIRSVQSLPVSQALAFVFVLKDVIREELGDELRIPRLADEWFELESRIDQLALLSFNLFARWRERVHEIRVREIKRRVSEYLRRIEIADVECAGSAADAWGGGPHP
jgi:hypothetical protein